MSNEACTLPGSSEENTDGISDIPGVERMPDDGGTKFIWCCKLKEPKLVEEAAPAKFAPLSSGLLNNDGTGPKMLLELLSAESCSKASTRLTLSPTSEWSTMQPPAGAWAKYPRC
mmetsp:Transcript_20808/g.45851  ORF Transcript_20808/g.45851 Transcript_20808/m.45851 type:complete len:115 (+) Transcript_20808:930-1274(+)